MWTEWESHWSNNWCGSAAAAFVTKHCLCVNVCVYQPGVTNSVLKSKKKKVCAHSFSVILCEQNVEEEETQKRGLNGCTYAKLRRILRGNDIDYSASCTLFTMWMGWFKWIGKMLSKLLLSRARVVTTHPLFIVLRCSGNRIAKCKMYI